MMLKEYDSIENAINGCFGQEVKIDGRSHVSGGDINDSFCLRLSNGQDVFVKANTIGNRSFFDAEEAGIGAIASTNTIGTPKLLCKGVDRDKGMSFLMMEMIPRTPMKKGFFTTFGRELAAMHLSDTASFVSGGSFGFDSDNFIGASKQINSPRDKWIDFFRECRLEPQIRMAEGYLDHTMLKNISGLLERLDKILVEPEKPSLLHGDLWSGNFITGTDGKAWLIDPAVYVGHAEADLAMTELFGRLPDEFYREYMSVYPIQQGYRYRRDLYNLYHMLNHLNLFGRSYLPSVMDIIRRYI